MRKALFILVVTLSLVAVAAGAYTWTDGLIASIYGYGSPLKGSPPLTEGSHRPLTSQVVLVLVDGLRYDASLQMPYLNKLRQIGAQAILTSSPPTNALAAWTSLISGTDPQISGAPLFDPSDEWIVPIRVDHLFAEASRVGLTCGISGSSRWEKLVPPEALYTKYFAKGKDDSADRQTTEHAMVFLNEFGPNLLLVHLQQLETIGANWGAAGDEYQEAVLRCDHYIQMLAESMDLSRSVFLVVSGYGQLDNGGHGGDEAMVSSMPFVMAGQHIVPGAYRTVQLIDVSTTVAAVLGLPFPTAAWGRLPEEMLRMTIPEKAEKWVALARQRARIASVYLHSIGYGPLSETAEGDVLVAISSLEVGSYESALSLATLSVRQADREILLARRSRIWKERTQRGLPMLLFMMTVLWLMWRYRGPRAVFTGVASLLGASLYHAVFLYQGGGYSFSRMPAAGFAATVEPGTRQAIVALGISGALLTWDLWRQRERSAFSVIRRTYAFALAQLYVICLLVGVCAWWNGFRFTWYLPSFSVAYVHLAALFQVMLIALLAIPLPFLVLIIQRGLLAVSDRYSLAQQTARLRVP